MREKKDCRLLAQRSDRRKAQTASASPMTRVETTAGSAQKESASEGQPQDTRQTQGRQNNPCAVNTHSCSGVAQGACTQASVA